jgi:hypothetical protein
MVNFHNLFIGLQFAIFEYWHSDRAKIKGPRINICKPIRRYMNLRNRPTLRSFPPSYSKKRCIQLTQVSPTYSTPQYGYPSTSDSRRRLFAHIPGFLEWFSDKSVCHRYLAGCLWLDKSECVQRGGTAESWTTARGSLHCLQCESEV